MSIKSITLMRYLSVFFFNLFSLSVLGELNPREWNVFFSYHEYNLFSIGYIVATEKPQCVISLRNDVYAFLTVNLILLKETS